MITFSKEEFAPYYSTYVDLAKMNDSIIEGLQLSGNDFMSFINSIPENKLEYRYEVNKWTIKDVVLHLIDAERIFAYRALRIARNDLTELPGFEENDYVNEANANLRSISNLIEEYDAVRKSTIILFSNFSNAQLHKIGKASNCSVSVRAIGVIIQGHEKHHAKIIKERYL